MDEIWKDILGYEGIYQISNYGRIKSLSREIRSRGDIVYNVKEKILNLSPSHYGYICINLSKESVVTAFKVHRLVAQAFIPNPLNLSQINHKDENKTNNFVYVNPDGSVDESKSNLEWCDSKYNINYGNRTRKVSIALRKKGRRVIQYSLNNKEIARYRSVKDAEEATGVLGSNIRACARHKSYRNKSGNYTPRFKAGGFKWEYE